LRTTRSFEVIGDAFAIARVGDALGEGREVVLLVGHLDVGEQLAALTDQVQASAQEIAGGAHAGRVHVGLGSIPLRSGMAILSASMRSFFALPPWIAFM